MTKVAAGRQRIKVILSEKIMSHRMANKFVKKKMVQ